jgi:hypothetical protein
MTDPARLPGDEDVRRLVDDARAIVAAITALPAEAPDDDPAAQKWAEDRARSVQQTWSQLQPALAAGDPLIFGAGIQALISESVPLADAPPSLVDAVAAVRTHTQRLGRDKFAILDPHVTAEGISAPAQASIGDSLRRIAAE